MLDLLDRKLRQMHAALANLGTNDLSAVQPQITYTDGFVYAKVDFNQKSDQIALLNAATLLVANIASLKDHLKAWCRRQRAPFHGETLINTNKSVALIHDLWNIDKHARTGSSPAVKLQTEARRYQDGTCYFVRNGSRRSGGLLDGSTYRRSDYSHLRRRHRTTRACRPDYR